jgi:hypothetical protein
MQKCSANKVCFRSKVKSGSSIASSNPQRNQMFTVRPTLDINGCNTSTYLEYDVTTIVGEAFTIAMNSTRIRASFSTDRPSLPDGGWRHEATNVAPTPSSRRSISRFRQCQRQAYCRASGFGGILGLRAFGALLGGGHVGATNARGSIVALVG